MTYHAARTLHRWPEHRWEVRQNGSRIRRLPTNRKSSQPHPRHDRVTKIYKRSMRGGGARFRQTFVVLVEAARLPEPGEVPGCCHKRGFSLECGGVVLRTALVRMYRIVAGLLAIFLVSYAPGGYIMRK